jgi:hypothetical protein
MMSMRMKKTTLLFLAALFMPVLLFAYQDPVEIGSARTSGMGGRHVASVDDFSTFLNNPAGLQDIEEEVSFSELTLHLKGPVFTLADIFLTGDTTALSDMLSNGLYSGMNLLGPLSFGYVGDGLGFGVYNNSDVIVKSHTTLTSQVIAQEELILTGGYAFPLLGEDSVHQLDMGILLKGGFRGRLDGAMTATEIISLDYTALMSEPFDFTSFIGIDLGLMYSTGGFAVGLVARDAFTPTHTNTYANINDFLSGATPTSANQLDLVPFNLDLGLRYSFDFRDRNLVISKLDTYLDYMDLLDFWLHPRLAVNPVLHVQVGAEATLLEILDVRAGLREGLPAAGIGLDLHHFTLNASMFGTERSSEPGLSPVYNLQIGLEFRN